MHDELLLVRTLPAASTVSPPDFVDYDMMLLPLTGLNGSPLGPVNSRRC